MLELLLFPAGIGMFLFSLQLLETAIGNLYSDHLKLWLQNFTGTPMRGICLGIFITAILQSSSLVGLMTLAFVGAGAIELKNAIGIILGSNLGTTLTGWIVTLVGFKLDLSSLFAPIMGLSAMGLVLIRAETPRHYAFQLIFAFGILLMSLSWMNDGVISIVDQVDVALLRSLPLLVYFLTGIVLTALIQSSSATMMITLSAMNAGLIDLTFASALVIGANLGTTSTIIIGALQGPAVKKQLALVHVLFNLIVSLLAFLALPLLILLVNRVFRIDDPLFELVAVYSSINLFGILLFFPFIQKLRRFVTRRFPEPEAQLLFIEKVSIDVPDASFSALEQDTANLMRASVQLNGWRLGLLPETLYERRLLLSDSVEKGYIRLKDQENKMTDYILDLQRQPLSMAQSVRAQQLLVCIRDTLFATKAVKDIHSNIKTFQLSSNKQNASIPTALLSSTEVFYRELLQALMEPSAFSVELLGQMLGRIKKAHTELNSFIYELIDNKVLEKDKASTALNINREMLLSGHSLINALEHFLLPGDEARTVSELLNLRS
ncbi:MAG: Na/Pi symporter [Pseudomonadales bacterium]|nr:Na/Pi symporter [Pseudomonadales bacterium]